jgi:glutamine amidotransferase
MYLVHSFYVSNSENSIALTNYEVEYCSALQKNNFYGVQFHPEKSGKFGEQILNNFLKIV